MRLHLPVKLFRALLACMAAVSFVTFTSASSACYAASEEEEENELRMLLAEQEYPNGSKTYTTRQTSALTLMGYESILFKDISSTSDGGAIYNYGSSTFTLSGNGAVTFSGNTASSSYGGAIDNRGSNTTFTLSGNGAVTFSGNTARYDGGAISNDYYATFTLSGNGEVTFSGNAAPSSGGAISNDYYATFTLSDNVAVTFSGNTASSYSSVSGGAIYNDATFTLSGNGEVTFSGNKASSSSSSTTKVFGGAIYNDATFTLSGNGDVTFSGNKASSSSSTTKVFGGAIYNYGSNATFTLSGNGSVTFSGNTASSDGGAIYNYGSNATFTLSGNGDVTFSGNSVTVTSSSSSAYGGAIYNTGTFTLSGNGDVLFERNAEILNGTYRLRSIYSEGTLNLSALEGKSILFRDSVYASGTVNLNQEGTGDIIFTGAYTESNLSSVKGELATESEIHCSLVSQFHADVILGGGSLLVQDGATLTFDGLTIGGASQSASLQLHHAKVSVLNAFTLANGSSLSFSGCNYLLSSGIVAEGNNTLSLTISEENRQHAVLSVEGNLQGESLVINLGDVSTLTGMNYRLLHVIGNSDDWKMADIRFSGASSDALTWVDGTLYYRYDSSMLTQQTGTDRTIANRLTVEGLELLTEYKSLTFEGTSSGITNSDYAVITENESVLFSGNYSLRYGGAIYNADYSRLSGNGAVMFSGNRAYDSANSLSTTAVSLGGAIHNLGYFTLNGNGEVAFSENRATASTSSSASSSSIYAYGGAIRNGGSFTLSGNGEVAFSENTAYTYSSITSSLLYAYGGAIDNRVLFNLSENGTVTFRGNTAHTYFTINTSSTSTSRLHAYGGAIYNAYTFTLCSNGEVSFSENSSSGNGGAIVNIEDFMLSENGNVNFNRNTASSGGAIFNSGVFTLKGNGAVLFSGNTGSAYGGAIYNRGTFILNDNGAVTFSENTVSTFGGAIYNLDTFTLSGNGDIIFEKNAEVCDGIYRLRSIYSEGTLNLSALGGKSILFRDSVYASGTVNLNQEGTGDIIFTGAYTESNLSSVKGELATESEIHCSLVSLFHADVILGGGSLLVQDGATLTFDGLTIGGASQSASLQLHQAKVGVLNAFTLANGSSLSFSGCNYLFSSGIVAEGNNTLSLTISEENRQHAVLSVEGNLQGESLVINLGDVSTLTGMNYRLLHVIGNSDDWKMADIRFSGASSDALTWVDGTLYYRYDSSMLTQQTGTDRTIANRLTVEGLELLTEYKSLTFEGASSGITNSDYAVITENESVLFSGNYSLRYGAIGNEGTFTLRSNGDVTFIGNTPSSCRAIYNSYDSTFTLNENERVSFSGYSSSDDGGAICNLGTFTLSENGNVNFNRNTASSGGAIHNTYNIFTLSENGDVIFNGNTASDYGGAINNKDPFTLSENGNVNFNRNTASSGGAIFNSDIFTLRENGEVLFCWNTGSAYGGAIYNTGTFTLRQNGDVTFMGNSTFGSSSYVFGGAIANTGTFTLSRNEDVTFSGNTTSGVGGAICSKYGTFTLSGNGDVIFEKNAEVSEGGYRLRSIYSEGTLNLSALEGKSILFRDSVYASGTVNLNQEGTGDIIFTGESIVADLRAVKGDVEGTAQEIADSRSSVLDTTVTLGGGTLQVRDAASLTVKSLTAENCSELVLHDASFTSTGNSKLAAVTTSGNSFISAQDGASITLTQAITNNGVLTLSGTIIADALDVVESKPVAVSGFINTAGVYGASGFFTNFDSEVQMVLTTGPVNGASAIVSYKDFGLTLGSDGVAVGMIGSVDWSTYYLNGGSAKLSEIWEKSPDAIVQLKGGTLVVDMDVSGAIFYDVNSRLLVTAKQTQAQELSGYADIQFSNTSRPGYGGAIENEGSFVLSDNGSVRFVENAVRYDGGAINNSDAFALNGNKEVSFVGNKASEFGGAIHSEYGPFTLTDNRMLTYSGNTAGDCGGAIANEDGRMTFSHNGKVFFSGNRAYRGGAIYNYGTITLSNNESVAFVGNSVSPASYNDSVYGGAIYNESGRFELSGNGTVCFSGNTVRTSSSSYGGVIRNSGTFSLSGNGDVLFEKNTEIIGESYLLRSIYSTRSLELSASIGHSIIFRDSLYASGTTTFNQTGAGDIIFTGATTEADLIEMKGGIAGTENEILNSRTSEIRTTLNLCGGRLIVADNAILKGRGLSTAAESGATVRLKNGTLNHGGYTLCFNADTKLEVEGANTITASSVDMQAGSTLRFVTPPGQTSEPILTLNGTLTTDTISISVSGIQTNEIGSYTYTLLRAENYDTASWSADKITVVTPGICFDDFSWENGTLVLSYVNDWHQLNWDTASGTWDENGTFGSGSFSQGDVVSIRNAAKISIGGRVVPREVNVDSVGNITFTGNKKVPGSGIVGEGRLVKSGAGMLTMNAGNTYSGGTTLNAGTLKATAVDSFGTGAITVNGGTLDLGSKAVANDIVLSGTATLKGDAKYVGSVTVAGDAALSAKTSYKGLTTIGSGSSLTLAEKATMAGSIAVDGGRFIITAPKGMTLAKGATLTLDKGGAVRGLLTVGAGSTLVWADGGFETASPVLKGGTLDLGAENSLTLTGSKAQVQFGDKRVELPGKGIVYTDETLTVNGGTVTLNAVNGYESGIEVAGGTLKLSTGKVTTDNEITVSGNAAVVNGKMHFGDITVNGTLAKGTNITIADGKTVQLNGTGVMLGTIAGAGTVDVNASIDATAAKITAAHINLNNGTFTNTKGIKLAKGQTLTLAGAALDLGVKGALATAAGSTLVVSSATSLTGNLTLGGGELVFAGGTLDVDGMLTLSKAMTVKGSGSITYTTLKPFKGDISVLFGGAEVVQEGNTLTITGEEAVGYRLAPAPLDMTPALPPAPVTNPVADAMVQADWGIIDAERAFMGAVNSRHQHAALLDKGRGAAWVSAFGSSVRHGNKGAHHGSDGNIEGAAFGLEHAVSETGSIGLAVGRSKNRIAATGVTHLRQETAHVALYGQKHLAHGFTADAAAAYGDTETKLGAASWSQKSAALTARLTHAQQLTDATAFRTFGGLAYEATDAGSIGSAHTGSVQNLRAELGAGITHTAGKAHLYAEAALTGDLVRHNPTADLDGFRTHGANPGRIGLRATVGGLYEFTDTWSGTASYGIETESRSTAHTLNIGASKSF